ncbi:MAG: hypothetical protein QOC82_2819, partial [Frankiaceae bacterium]|nr:hypothetical protein [Frankiaceae bacterium]
ADNVAPTSSPITAPLAGDPEVQRNRTDGVICVTTSTPTTAYTAIVSTAAYRMYDASSSWVRDNPNDASIASAPTPMATIVSRNARRDTIRPDGPSYAGMPATAGTATANGAKHCEHHVAASGDPAPHDVQLRTS